MIRRYYGLVGRLIEPAAADSTILAVDNTTMARLHATMEFGDSFHFQIATAGVVEVVKVVGVEDYYISVERGREGTQAVPFPAGAVVSYVLTSADIIADLENRGLGATVIEGSQLVQVEEYLPGRFSLMSPMPTINGIRGVEILGEWPNIAIAYSPANECCGPATDEYDGGGSTNIALSVSGILSGYAYGTELYLGVQAPQFNATGGLTVTGSWPYYTFSLASGVGTVSEVTAGAGLVLTGSPNTNPTLTVANTGVTAGEYGDVHINARGQITYVSPTFNPISVLTAGEAITLDRTGNAVVIGLETAAIGVPGAVALADETDDFDPTNNRDAATPAVIATALGSLVIPTVTGAASFIGEADGDYNNLISASSLAITLDAGERAIVHAEATAVNLSDPTAVISYGLGVFDSTPAKVRSNRRIPQNQQSMSFVVEGPVNTGYVIATTAMPAGANVVSWSLWIEKF